MYRPLQATTCLFTWLRFWPIDMDRHASVHKTSFKSLLKDNGTDIFRSVWLHFTTVLWQCHDQSKGTSFQDHLHNIRKVLTRIRDIGLTLNALKCCIFQTTLPYLGHIIDHCQIRLDPARVRSIVDMPALKTARKLKEFKGMSWFCNHFLPHCSEIASPLHHLTERDVPFN